MCPSRHATLSLSFCLSVSFLTFCPLSLFLSKCLFLTFCPLSHSLSLPNSASFFLSYFFSFSFYASLKSKLLDQERLKGQERSFLNKFQFWELVAAKNPELSTSSSSSASIDSTRYGYNYLLNLVSITCIIIFSL